MALSAGENGTVSGPFYVCAHHCRCLNRLGINSKRYCVCTHRLLRVYGPENSRALITFRPQLLLHGGKNALSLTNIKQFNCVLVCGQYENKAAFLTPFLSREIRSHAVGTVRTPSGHRGRPRGRTDPPDGSPGPWEHKESGPQRAGLPERPSAAPSAPGSPCRPSSLICLPIRRTMP